MLRPRFESKIATCDCGCGYGRGCGCGCRHYLCFCCLLVVFVGLAMALPTRCARRIGLPRTASAAVLRLMHCNELNSKSHRQPCSLDMPGEACCIDFFKTFQLQPTAVQAWAQDIWSISRIWLTPPPPAPVNQTLPATRASIGYPHNLNKAQSLPNNLHVNPQHNPKGRGFNPIPAPSLERFNAVLRQTGCFDISSNVAVIVFESFELYRQRVKICHEGRCRDL